MKIFTDGSVFRNGQPDAYGGLGVYFGPDDPRNKSQVLTRELIHQSVTSILAELLAIMTALLLAPQDEPLDIYTDSLYALKCLTTWCRAWERNGWKKRNGQDVSHKDLLRSLLYMCREHGRVTFHHVRSHTPEPSDPMLREIWWCNREADRLAQEASRVNLIT